MADNYREIFSGIRDVKFRCLDPLATEDRVVDDSIVSFEVVKEGFIAPAAGAKAEMRPTHIFEMRDGKISKEIGIEGPQRAR